MRASIDKTERYLEPGHVALSSPLPDSLPLLNPSAEKI